MEIQQEQQTSSINSLQDTLKKIYFFTDQQIADVLAQGIDDHLLEHIVFDVEAKYKITPLEISINDYLYEALMNIQTIDAKDRNHEIMNIIDTILDEKNITKLVYTQFLPREIQSYDGIYTNLEAYFAKTMKDFFVVYIREDVQIPEKNRYMITKKLISDYLPRTYGDGIYFYVLVQKDDSIKIAIGASKGTIGNTNNRYFGQLAKKYDAPTVSIPLSRFVQSS